MKHLVLLILMGFFAINASAQENGAPAVETKPVMEETGKKGPEMSLESLVVDFGEIEQNSDPFRYVKFTNTGDEPLIILNAKGSCGCTVPTYPKEPISPGETSEIKVRYDTKRLGSINKTVKLTTNDGTGEYVLRVQGNISPAPEKEGLPEKEGIMNKPNR